MLRRARLSARAMVLVLGAAMALGLLLGGAAAFAVPNPPTSTIVDGGDGYLNASEVGAVMVTGTFDAGATPPVNRITARIVGDQDCDAGAPYQTANQDAMVTGPGQWQAGPFDLSAWPDGLKACVRVRASDNAGVTYGGLGVSTNRPLKDTVALPGTLVLEDPNNDGYMNIAEAFTFCEPDGTGCIPAIWTAAGTDAVGANIWFEEADGDIPAGANCGPYYPANDGPVSSTAGYVNETCAAGLTEGMAFTFNGVWRDAAGNISAEAASNALIKDTLAPVAPTVSVDSDPIKVANVAAVQVSGSSEHDTKVGITLGDGVTTLAKNGVILDEDDEFSVTFDASSLLDCNYPLTNECITAKAYAIDLAGNIGAEGSDKVFKDATAPAAPTITVEPETITDPNRQHVEVTIDGEHLGTVSLSVNDTDPGTPALTSSFQLTSPATTFMDLSALTEGTITFTATVADRVGNVSPIATKNVLKQLTATSVTLTSPTPGSLDDETVVFAGTATPGAEVTVYESKNGQQLVLGRTTAEPTGAWSLSYYYTTKTSGAHTVFARVANGLGSAKVTFNVDVARPVATIAQPADKQVYMPDQEISFEGLASDDFSAVTEVDVFLWNTEGRAIDHRKATCSGCNSLSASWTLSGPNNLSPGIYLLQAWAVDKVGHRSAQPAEIRIIVL